MGLLHLHIDFLVPMPLITYLKLDITVLAIIVPNIKIGIILLVDAIVLPKFDRCDWTVLIIVEMTVFAGNPHYISALFCYSISAPPVASQTDDILDLVLGDIPSILQEEFATTTVATFANVLDVYHRGANS